MGAEAVQEDKKGAETVKTFKISFTLAGVKHVFTAEAKNEYTAIKNTLKTVEPRKAAFCGFKIKQITGAVTDGR